MLQWNIWFLFCISVCQLRITIVKSVVYSFVIIFFLLFRLYLILHLCSGVWFVNSSVRNPEAHSMLHWADWVIAWVPRCDFSITAVDTSMKFGRLLQHRSRMMFTPLFYMRFTKNAKNVVKIKECTIYFPCDISQNRTVLVNKKWVTGDP